MFPSVLSCAPQVLSKVVGSRFRELMAAVGADMGLTEKEKKGAVPFYCDHVEPQGPIV